MATKLQRMNVFLLKAQRVQLKRVADAANISVAQVIRTAVNEYLRKQQGEPQRDRAA